MSFDTPSLAELTNKEASNLSRLLLPLYRAPLDPTAWKTFLSEVAKAFDARGAHIGITNIETGEVLLDEVTGYDFKPTDYEAYKGRFSIDPRVKQMLAQPLRPTHCREYLTDKQFRETEVYRKVLAAVDMEYTLCASLDTDPSYLKFIAIMRGADGKPFTEVDRQALETLVPHVANALKIDTELSTFRGIEHSARTAVDRTGVGWVALDEKGTVLKHNEGATEIIPSIASGSALNFTDARGKTLSGHIQRCLKSENYGVVAFETIAADGRRTPTVVARIAQYGGLRSWVQPKEAMFNILFASQFGGHNSSKVEIIKAVFGLSNRQAEIALHIVAGNPIREAAEHMAIQESTARQYLKSAMAKLDVHNQAQLALKIAQVTAFDS